MRIDPNTAMKAKGLVNKHPTPWHIADNGLHGDGTSYAWICDAVGQTVIGASEWLDADYETLATIVRVFNCLKPSQ